MEREHKKKNLEEKWKWLSQYVADNTERWRREEKIRKIEREEKISNWDRSSRLEKIEKLKEKMRRDPMEEETKKDRAKIKQTSWRDRREPTEFDKEIKTDQLVAGTSQAENPAQAIDINIRSPISREATDKKRIYAPQKPGYHPEEIEPIDVATDRPCPSGGPHPGKAEPVPNLPVELVKVPVLNLPVELVETPTPPTPATSRQVFPARTPHRKWKELERDVTVNLRMVECREEENLQSRTNQK